MKLNEWFEIECLKYKDDDGKMRTPFNGRIEKRIEKNGAEPVLVIHYDEPGQEEFSYEFTTKGVEEFIEKANGVLEDMLAVDKELKE